MIPPDISTATLLSIKNTISLYCLALDTHDFDLLHKVFSKDVKAEYAAVSPQYPNIEGLDTFLERITSILNGKVTQHALSTQILDFEATGTDSWDCNAITYFTANTFFGLGRDGNKLDHVSVFGRYEDQLVEVESGEWRIVKRVVKTFVSEILSLSRKISRDLKIDEMRPIAQEEISIDRSLHSIQGSRILLPFHETR